MLSGRGLCDELITRPEESYRLCCVVCDLETSRMGAAYIYDISRLRVNDVQRLPNQKDEIWNICVSLFMFQKKDFHIRMRLISWKFLTFMLLSRGEL